LNRIVTAKIEEMKMKQPDQGAIEEMDDGLKRVPVTIDQTPGKGVVEATETLVLRTVDTVRQMAEAMRAQNTRIAQLEEHQRLFDGFRAQFNKRLLEIVEGKQLVLDPVLSQRLQTMANTLGAPTYQIEDKNGRVLSIRSVGSFAGTVKITVDI
jgi:hypothetical protein